MANLKLYAIIALMAFSVISGGATLLLWNKNKALNAEISKLEDAREKALENMELANEQLDAERELRQKVETILVELGGVPDVDYNTPLPDSIRRVLTDFADSVR